MISSSPLCVDANLVVRLVAVPSDANVNELWKRWRTERRPLVAPRLIRYEVVNALHGYIVRGDHRTETIQAALVAMLALPIEMVDDEDLHEGALRIAARLKRPSTYDAHYLALAERDGIEFWTADGQLYNAVRHHLPWVRFVQIEQ
jgi:predicted nucleic acid-binding protein